MFNALNRFIARLDGDPQQQQQRQRESYGFQVLRNTNLELAIEPWFDFIVGINGRMIDNPDSRLFAQEVRNCAGGSVSLGIWSAKGQRTRALHIPVPASTGSLGLSLQWTPLSAASENVWHVLDVAANSPADTAGLLPYGDYVLGTPDGTLHGEAALGELVDDHVNLGRPLRLWVYNHEYDVTREVAVTPSREWGGEGALGCVLGYGALHRLPAPLSEPVHAPGETLFDGDGGGGGVGNDGQFATLAPPATANAPSAPGDAFAPGAGSAPPASPSSNEFLIPAQMVSATSSPANGGAAPPPPRGGRKKEHRHAHGHNQLDDYFAEQEKKSKEIEGSVTANKSPPPPPPKAGSGIPPPPKAPPKPRAATEGDDGGVD
ncbi:hypothetical protein DL766_009303 [Monosporascus sp. MC13-8B]|uniref:PDZ GRASP-type domain-containing protein n=1 Tax=Monosporascus cannonballus TaxID=155416 RepID=A0ABY0HCB6_9PEZI|nr:hypothetical protein DL762_003831 [Monosporascus cannonballus]RYO92824.1 hypothetical protein DL763_004549 [Monosporascus cannonballus]RYP15827.1 hypothetical protein DL766_009303 [Monosporascus sp. MC13-8B]